MDQTFLALIQDFVDETAPLAEAVADAALELGKRWAQGEHAPQLFQRVRSDLHTLKGNSAMMGFSPIQAAAHALEDVCGAIKDEPGFRSLDTAQLLVDGAEALMAMISAAAKGDVDGRLAESLMARVREHLAAGPAVVAAGAASSAGGTSSLSGVMTLPATPSGVMSLPPMPVPAAPVAPASSPAAALSPVASAPAATVPPPGPAVASAASAALDEARGGADAVVASDSIRVDFHRLDEMLELVGEAVITQGALLQDARDLGQASDLGARLEGHVVELGKSLRELKETLMKTRLLPVSLLFARFARYVQKLAHERGQPIRFVTSGGETPIDKTIIDRLSEPLMHIVRNAVAHGIEPPDERSAVGKPIEATISLLADYAGERVTISVADDGRGIDVQAVLAKARALGMEVGALSDEDARRLIVSPGFSTAKEVTQLSGRGVGLDAVAKVVQHLGGSVDVDSVTGRGTMFALDLPLTLAVVQGLVFEVDGERFAVAMTSVHETLRADAQLLRSVGRVGMLDLRGELTPVVDAGALLGTTEQGGRRAYLIVVASGVRRRGLIVDKLLGFQEIVVKTLDDTLGRFQLISGATILGDGRVALILDPSGIVQQRVVVRPQPQLARAPENLS
ncbi:MAG: chemotaxis protein CheA [Deltaproteobacteria bacterium]|nr:chemotaxis protein CheA [Deltaproteobacteria bacterium]